MELKDTIPFMTSDDWKERLLGEYLQVIIRLKGLQTYLITAEENYKKNMLIQQAEYMRFYAQTLKTRLIIEDVNFLEYQRKVMHE